VGAWPSGNGAGGDADVNRLIDRVQSAGNGNAATVRDALETAVRTGNLILERGHERSRWRWRDYL
jgi:hypothetical protein